MPVPGLDFTVTSVVAHAANGPLWYALDLWGGPSDDAAFDLKDRLDVSNSALLVSLRSAARACAASVDGAGGNQGLPSGGRRGSLGFAAMACDELLVHTGDAARGLGLRFSPDPDLAARVLGRLFPWHDPGDDPWRTLLRAHDRADRPGFPRQRGWTWHCAPLDDRDGKPRPLR